MHDHQLNAACVLVYHSEENNLACIREDRSVVNVQGQKSIAEMHVCTGPTVHSLRRKLTVMS